MFTPRDAVFSERRRFHEFGAADDFHSIVQRRLVALGYSMNDQGDVVDDSGNTIVAADDTSGTGSTPAELTALGYTPDQIALASGSVSTIATPNPTPLTGAPTSTGQASSSSSWISGIGSLFGSVGTAITNVSRAAGNPNINPQTGVRYGINPATGKPYVAASTQTNVLVLLVFAIIIWAVVRG